MGVPLVAKPRASRQSPSFAWFRTWNGGQLASTQTASHCWARLMTLPLLSMSQGFCTTAAPWNRPTGVRHFPFPAFRIGPWVSALAGDATVRLTAAIVATASNRATSRSRFTAHRDSSREGSPSRALGAGYPHGVPHGRCDPATPTPLAGFELMVMSTRQSNQHRRIQQGWTAGARTAGAGTAPRTSRGAG